VGGGRERSTNACRRSWAGRGASAAGGDGRGGDGGSQTDDQPVRASLATCIASLRSVPSLACSDAQVATGLDAGVRPLLYRLVAEGAAKVEGQKSETRYVASKGG
jgi:hypothetical protein